MIDLSTIGIKVDSRSVKDGAKDLDKLSKQADKTEKGVNKATEQMNSGFKSSIGIIKGLGAALVAVGAVRFLKGAMDEAVQFEKNMNVINQLVQQTGASAWTSGEQLKEQARSIAISTLQSVEGVMGAQQTLLTFRKIQGEIFDRTLESAADMSAALGIDMKSATLQLGKALEDPITGMSALTRSGTVFTEQQKDMVRAMVESGDQALAQKFILSELEAQYGGAGKAAAEGMAGALDTLSQRWQEFKINLMSDDAGTLTRTIHGIANAVQFLDKLIRSVILAFSDAGDAIGAFAAASASALSLDFQGAKDIMAMRADTKQINDEKLAAIWEEKRAIEETSATRKSASAEEMALMQKYSEMKALDAGGVDPAMAEAQKIRDQNINKFAALAEGYYTELEMIQVQEERKLAVLNDALMAEAITWEQHDQYKTLIEEEGAAARLAVTKAEADSKKSMLNDLSNGVVGLLMSGGKKAFEIGKKISLAEAMVTGAKAIQAAWASGMQVGGPYAPITAAAYAAAATLKSAQHINAIKSQTFSGGSSSVSGGSGGVSTGGPEPVTAQQAPARAQQDLTIKRVGGGFWRDEEVEALLEKLGEYTRDNDIALGKVGFA